MIFPLVAVAILELGFRLRDFVVNWRIVSAPLVRQGVCDHIVSQFRTEPLVATGSDDEILFAVWFEFVGDGSGMETSG
jgi:hypothetical protein